MKTLTSPEGSAAITTNTGYVPVNKTATNTLRTNLFKAEPNRLPAIEQAPGAVQWFQWPGNSSEEITKVLSDALSAAVNGADPKDALRAAAERARGLV